MKAKPKIHIQKVGADPSGIEYHFEHFAGKDKMCWLGYIDADGRLHVHNVGGGEYEDTDYGKAPKDHSKAIIKTISILKKKYGIDIGQKLTFAEGISAEQTLSPHEGKTWVIMDRNGDTIAMYYPKLKEVELNHKVFGRNWDSITSEEFTLKNIDSLKQAVMSVWLALENKRISVPKEASKTLSEAKETAGNYFRFRSKTRFAKNDSEYEIYTKHNDMIGEVKYGMLYSTNPESDEIESTGIIVKSKKDAIRKILEIYKKFGVELGKKIEFPGGYVAWMGPWKGEEETWYIDDPSGHVSGKYNPYSKSVDVTSKKGAFYGDIRKDIPSLSSAVMTVFMDGEQNRIDDVSFTDKLNSQNKIRNITREVLMKEYSDESSNANDFVKWFENEDAEFPGEYYASQQTDGVQNDPAYAIGWIYKNLLHGISPSDRTKWETIEPFYGTDFEKATEILLEYWVDKYKIDIGKRYELPGGIYAVEFYGGESRKFRKRLVIYFNGRMIGSYYPDAKIVSYRERGNQFPIEDSAEDLNRAAFVVFANHEKRRVSEEDPFLGSFRG